MDSSKKWNVDLRNSAGSRSIVIWDRVDQIKDSFKDNYSEVNNLVNVTLL